MAFEVNDIEDALRWLASCGVKVEAVRMDEITQKRFTFFDDPDGLPIELYEK